MARRLRSVWPILLVCALALALGLWRLGEQSFNNDEGVAAATTRLRWGELGRFFADREPNNIVYFGFLHVWHWLGSSEAWLRFPSVVCVVVAVALTAAVGWRSFGRTAGVAAGLLLALNA